MPHSNPVNWQPISEMPLIASMIDGALDDTRIHLETLTQARTRPHVLDDATIDRSKQVHTEQLEFVDIYARQISRWRTATPSAEQMRELNRMDGQNGGFKWLSQHLEAGGYDGRAKAAFGSNWAGAIVVTGPPAGGRTGGAAAVLGNDRGGYGERGCGG